MVVSSAMLCSSMICSAMDHTLSDFCCEADRDACLMLKGVRAGPSMDLGLDGDSARMGMLDEEW